MISSSDIQQQIARLEEKALQLKEQVYHALVHDFIEKILGSTEEVRRADSHEKGVLW